MRDTHYMFSSRLYFHLHNTRKNSAFLKEMQKRTEENIYLGLQGKLICGQKETNTRPMEEQGRDPHGPAIFDKLPEEGKKFSVAMFPIEQMHKVLALNTDTFILWHRDWQSNATVSDEHLKVPGNASDLQKIFFPRIVGPGDNPEMGCHFILWVFDITTKNIRLYDNTSQYLTISDLDMEILKVMHPQIKSLGWIQCDLCQKWLHADCAGRGTGAYIRDESRDSRV
ncbi:hypothetical protein PO909_000607 [Leuciscus waleckii]